MRVTEKGIKIFLAIYFLVFILSSLAMVSNKSLTWLAYPLSGITIGAFAIFLTRKK